MDRTFEQIVLAIAGLALVALLIARYNASPAAQVAAVPVDDPNIGSLTRGPAYLMSAAPYAYQPWAGGFATPQVTGGQQGQDAKLTPMAFKTDCGC